MLDYDGNLIKRIERPKTLEEAMKLPIDTNVRFILELIIARIKENSSEAPQED